MPVVTAVCLGEGYSDKMFSTGVEHKCRDDILKPDGYRQSVYALLLCTLAINLLSLALPVMTLQVYDRILPNPGTGTLPVLVTGVCVAIFLEVLLRLSRSYVIGRAGAAYEHRMACRAVGTRERRDLCVMPYLYEYGTICIQSGMRYGTV